MVDLIIKNVDFPVSSREQLILHIYYDKSIHVEGEPFSNAEVVELPPHGDLKDADMITELSDNLIRAGLDPNRALAIAFGGAPVVLEASE